MSIGPGSSLGPYEIRGSVGAGGMGEVYLAQDTRLNRTVAVKILPDSVRKDPEMRERLMREARAAALLTHPNILTVHDVGKV